MQAIKIALQRILGAARMGRNQGSHEDSPKISEAPQRIETHCHHEEKDAPEVRFLHEGFQAAKAVASLLFSRMPARELGVLSSARRDHRTWWRAAAFSAAAFAFLVVLLSTLTACPAYAQLSTFPVTAAAIVANGVACPVNPSTPLVALLPNVSSGSQYLVSYTTGGSPTAVFLVVQGSNVGAAGPFFQMSDTATDPVNGLINGQSYFPYVQVSVYCTGGTSPTITISFAGTSSPNTQSFSQVDSGNYRKVVTNGAAANANITESFDTPYGNSAGWIVVQTPSGASGNSGTVSVSYNDQCNTTSFVSTFTLAGPFALTVNSAPIAFAVPPFPTCAVTVTYNHGAISTGVVAIEYDFIKPGGAPPPAQTVHINTAATTSAKGGPGSLDAISINTPVGGETIEVFDLPAASCTSTPTTNVRALITIPATAPPPWTQTFGPTGMQISLGVCILTSSTADLSVQFN